MCGVLSAAADTQYHEFVDATERDSLGDHLQRTDHHRVDPAGAQRRALSPDRSGLTAAAQSAHLRRRRHHHSVRRHQGNRPHSHRLAPRLRRRAMLKEIRPAIVFILALTVLSGLVYPLVMTGIAGVIFPYQSQGSMIEQGGKVVRSALIGQEFTSDRYFHGRPSATVAPDPNDASKTVPAPYNAANSGGSNLGPTNKALVERVQGDVEKLKQENPSAAVPIDLATTSGGGLDPHIEGRTLGFLGEPRVNVLALNLALDGGSVR